MHGNFNILIHVLSHNSLCFNALLLYNP